MYLELDKAKTYWIEWDDSQFPANLFAFAKKENVERATVRFSAFASSVTLLPLDDSFGVKVDAPIQILHASGTLIRKGDGYDLSIHFVGSRRTDFGSLEQFGGSLGEATFVRGTGVIETYRSVGSFEELPPKSSPNAQTIPPMAQAWADVAAFSEERPRVSTPAAVPSGPPPLSRLRPEESEGATPQARDVVEHFAFGRCTVTKSDGERLLLKVEKDGRFREIAIEMLKVTEIESSGSHRRFRLDRKM